MADSIQVFDGTGDEDKAARSLLPNDLDACHRIICVLAGQIASIGLVKKQHRAHFVDGVVDSLFTECPELRKRIFEKTRQLMESHTVVKDLLRDYKP